ncbi:MAG: division/cell wall cluster transcriptional repressor MraZ [Firmicutes bacterium]|nr:division/cell wall cluster transcriptional repressor MraZ [Bacillota bacterium]
MFIGEHQHSLDDKGRLIMPAKFREGLGESFIITRGLDNCLFVYPQQEWNVLQQKMKSLPSTKADTRAFVRFFFSGASECEVDKQGRVLIPASLREYARLEKDVVVAGVSSRVEIWAEEAWRQYREETGQNMAAIAEKIMDIEL